MFHAIISTQIKKLADKTNSWPDLKEINKNRETA